LSEAFTPHFPEEPFTLHGQTSKTKQITTYSCHMA